MRKYVKRLVLVMIEKYPLSLPKDLGLALHLVYEPSGFACTDFIKESESEAYGAFMFRLDERLVLFRTAKITPTKIGQFVTLWKRIGKGPILPYDIADSIDLFVISVRDSGRVGQFVFPKAVLWEKGVLSKEGKGGKRAIRVYPPWDTADNPQAKKSQKWQLEYFFEIRSNEHMDSTHILKLFR